jgi:hypothetical protein
MQLYYLSIKEVTYVTNFFLYDNAPPPQLQGNNMGACVTCSQYKKQFSEIASLIFLFGDTTSN